MLQGWRAFWKNNPTMKMFGLVISLMLTVFAQALIGTVGQAAGVRLWSDWQWLTGTLILFLFVTAGMLTSLKGSVGRLNDRAALSIDYYPLAPHGDPDKRRRQAQALYGAARGVIERAKPDGARILAVNSFVEVGGENADDQVEEQASKYLQELDRRIGKVHYHRIVQLARADLDRLPGGSISDLISDTYLPHYRNMVAPAKPTADEPTMLEATAAKYPTSFVIVKNREDTRYGGRLIWQMHQHVPDLERADKVQLTGVYIVVDPDAVMIGTFVKWFNELTGGERRVPLSLANLNGDPLRSGPKPEATAAADAAELPQPRRGRWPKKS
mgnify:FL=1